MNEPSTALPNAWLERLFERLLTIYGRKFAEQWSCVDPATLKAAWANDLAGIEPKAIGLAIEACKSRPFPPTLPEFLALCGKAEIDPEAAFVEAATKWPSLSGWSSPAVYWAAAAIGNDVHRMTWREIRGRWTFELDRAKREAKPIPDEIPPERQIEPPAGHRESADEARDRVMGAWHRMQAESKAKPREPGQDDEEEAAAAA